MSAKQRVIDYIDIKGISKSNFYQQTGLSNGFLDSGKGIGSDKIEIIISMFPDINLNWLITGEGEMFSSKFDQLKYATPKLDKLNQKKVTYKGNPNGNLMVNEDEEIYKSKKLLTVTVDSNNKENIVLVPVKAAAGYLTAYMDTNFIQKLQSFSLPNLIDQTYRAFEITGESMQPTVHANDWLICSYVESFPQIREGYIYIIVSEDGIVAKRVFKQNQYLELVSDNDNYKPYSLPFKNIIEVWRVVTKISSHLPAPNDTEKRIVALEISLQKVLGKLK